MGDVAERLQRCFAAVFPELPADRLAHASPQTVAAWDSVASVTLFAIIEEEFALEIDVQDMKDLLSFDSILQYLQRRDPAAP
jgi:acyl carrier protein